jgi:nitroimidazol reductase NimA-like FMN-containing flavoprotein (pyridoxamine 5'-phosphate oxidase superfamily)
VTFEVDRVDPMTRSGWSVVVHGFAQEVTVLDGPGHLEKLRGLPLHPWAGGDRHHLVRITAREVTGRRVGLSMPVAAPAAAAGAALGVLDTQACICLLRTHRIGRLAFADRGWPVVLPVNYAYEEPNLVIRTGPGAKLESTPLTAVAFEIDDADPEGTWGWSVMVQGPAFDITDEGDAYSQRLRLAPVRPWAPGERLHWLKVSAVHVGGRFFGAVPEG